MMKAALIILAFLATSALAQMLPMPGLAQPPPVRPYMASPLPQQPYLASPPVRPFMGGGFGYGGGFAGSFAPMPMGMPMAMPMPMPMRMPMAMGMPMPALQAPMLSYPNYFQPPLVTPYLPGAGNMYGGAYGYNPASYQFQPQYNPFASQGYNPYAMYYNSGYNTGLNGGFYNGGLYNGGLYNNGLFNNGFYNNGFGTPSSFSQTSAVPPCDDHDKHSPDYYRIHKRETKHHVSEDLAVTDPNEDCAVCRQQQRNFLPRIAPNPQYVQQTSAHFTEASVDNVPRSTEAPPPVESAGTGHSDVVSGSGDESVQPAARALPPPPPPPPLRTIKRTFESRKPSRPGVGEPVPETNRAIIAVRERNVDERKAVSAPVWHPFLRNLSECAPGCAPTNYMAWEYGRTTCHSTGKAIDVFALICPRKGANCTYNRKLGGYLCKAINDGYFAQVVQCMKKKMIVLFHNHNPRVYGITEAHYNHAHFSMGCIRNGHRFW